MNAERLLQIVRQVDSPWVGINLDVGNFPTDAYRQIELCAPYAVNVHFKHEVKQDGKPEPADWASFSDTSRRCAGRGEASDFVRADIHQRRAAISSEPDR